MMHLTHTPFRDALHTTAGDELFRLLGEVNKKIKAGKRAGHRFEVENQGTRFTVKLLAREGKSPDLVPTGCYLTLSVLPSGQRKILKVFVNTKVSGNYSDVIDRKGGVTELHEFAQMLHSAVKDRDFEG